MRAHAHRSDGFAVVLPEALWKAFGRAAREHVRHAYLLPRILLDELRPVNDARAPRGKDRSAP